MSNNLKFGDIFFSKLIPNRSLRLLRKFSKNSNDRYFDFISEGWFVQGVMNNLDFGSEYEIKEFELLENYSKVNPSSFWYKIKKLVKLRVKFSLYYK